MNIKPCNAATYRKATYDLAMANKHTIVAEVGVYMGGLSSMLATLPNLGQLFVIDSWDGQYSSFGQKHMNRIAEQVIAWGRATPKVTVRREDSIYAAQYFMDESIDFFHTDGDHSLEGIRLDINTWLPKVRVGGIISGDNYEAHTVAQGVDDLLPHRELLANGRLWWARKSA